MKRRDLLRHLNDCGRKLLSEGGNHFWWWNPTQNRHSAFPRHSEINDLLGRKTCKDLGLPPL